MMGMPRLAEVAALGFTEKDSLIIMTPLYEILLIPA